jgi:hypothetical protein
VVQHRLEAVQYRLGVEAAPQNRPRVQPMIRQTTMRLRKLTVSWEIATFSATLPKQNEIF